jgi:protein-tyrosine-phosphatase
MYQFDESFLDTVGLSAMPQEQRAPFLEYAQEQLEVRIGEAMSKELSEEQLNEFDRIADNDSDTIQNLLAQMGDYKNDADFKSILANTGAAEDDPEVLNNFVTVKWLEKNCPQYRTIIKTSIADLQTEIYNQREALLA